MNACKKIKFSIITLSPAPETTPAVQSSETTQTAAAAVIAGHTDLLTQILLRLPLQSIAKFQSVSTDWHSLLTSPYFTGRRIQNPNTTLPALLLHPTSTLNRAYPETLPFLPEPKLCFVPLDRPSPPGPPPLTSLSFVNPNSHTYICNSCNGLLICCDPTRKNYFIVNPTTHKSIKLPTPTNTSFVLGMNLAYDPNYFSSHHYEVVCVGLSSQYDLQINVYSSQSQAWKSCPVDPIFEFIRYYKVRFDSGVYLDGVIHWVRSEGNSSYYFDLDNKSINQIPFPEFHQLDDDSNRVVRYFGKWEGRLYLIYHKESARSKLYVYEMKSNYSGWAFKFDLNLDCSIGIYFSINFMYWEDDDYEDDHVREKEKLVLVLHVPNKIIRYKVKEGTMEKIIDIPSISLKDDPENVGFRRYGWFDVFPYFESLACV